MTVDQLIALNQILERAALTSRARVLRHEDEGAVDAAHDVLRELVKLGLEVEENRCRFALARLQLGDLASVVDDLREVVRARRQVGDGVNNRRRRGGHLVGGLSESLGEGVVRRRRTRCWSVTKARRDAGEDLDGEDGVRSVEVLEHGPGRVEAGEVSAIGRGSTRSSRSMVST